MDDVDSYAVCDNDKFEPSINLEPPRLGILELSRGPGIRESVEIVLSSIE